MKKWSHYLLGTSLWIGMVMIGGWALTGIWNYGIVKWFNVPAIAYYYGLGASFIISVLKRRRRCVRHFHCNR